MKKYYLLLICLYPAVIVAQKGFNTSFSFGYGLPIASGKLDPATESHFSFSAPANIPSPVGSYGSGLYLTLGAGYVYTKYIETGINLGYQQSTTALLIDNAAKYTYKGSSATITPYIRIRKHLTGPFIPYIHIGLPVAFVDAEIKSENNSMPPANRTLYFPRELTLGFNGGLGFYNVASNHVQLFFELNFIGLNFKPAIYNTKERAYQFGNSYILPFSAIRFGFGIRYNFTKMIDSL
jgi:hypothetical protein